MNYSIINIHLLPEVEFSIQVLLKAKLDIGRLHYAYIQSNKSIYLNKQKKKLTLRF